MQRMIEIVALDNGAHRNQVFHGIVPDGWAVVPADMKSLENFPFGEVKAEKIDGVMTVVKWTPGEVPESGTTALTPAQQREAAYNNQPLIEWDGETLTVTQAAQKWQYYAAEGDYEKTEELTEKIATAKQTIREQYPDEEVQ